MKLLVHLEEYFDKLKKQGWKSDDKDIVQGVQSATSKWQKKEGGKQTTIFNKSARADLDTDFDLSSNMMLLFNELAARKIINMINVAGKAYGYGNSLYPIPVMHKYEIEYNPKKKNVTIHFQNSGFNKIATPSDRSKQQSTRVRMMRDKVHIFNVLLGNGDAHENNFVTNKDKNKMYGIDFGLAFVHSYGDAYTQPLFNIIKEKIGGASKKTDAQEKQIAASFMNFLEMFLEHNAANMEKVLVDTAKEISKEVAKKILETNPAANVEEKALGGLSMFTKAIDEKKKVIKHNIATVQRFINKVKEELL